MIATQLIVDVVVGVVVVVVVIVVVVCARPASTEILRVANMCCNLCVLTLATYVF